KEYITIPNRTPLIKENLYNDKGPVSKEQYIDIETIKKYIPVLIKEQIGYGIKRIQDKHLPTTHDIHFTIMTYRLLHHYNNIRNKYNKININKTYIKTRTNIINHHCI